jgi:hypothetical protein
MTERLSALRAPALPMSDPQSPFPPALMGRG